MKNTHIYIIAGILILGLLLSLISHKILFLIPAAVIALSYYSFAKDFEEETQQVNKKNATKEIRQNRQLIHQVPQNNIEQTNNEYTKTHILISLSIAMLGIVLYMIFDIILWIFACAVIAILYYFFSKDLAKENEQNNKNSVSNNSPANNTINNENKTAHHIGIFCFVVVLVALIAVIAKNQIANLEYQKKEQKIREDKEQKLQDALEEVEKLQKELEEKLQKEKNEEEQQQLYKNQREQEIKQWLEGEWVVMANGYPLRFAVNNGYGVFTDNHFGNIGEGHIVIDVDKGIIRCGSSTLRFDYNDNNKTLYSYNFNKFSKVSSSRCRGSSHQSPANINIAQKPRRNDAWGVTEFRCSGDVINYTSQHTFEGNDGTTIRINFNGLYINGQLVTSAPRVTYYSGTYATIECSVPGMQTFRISVNASSGTLSENGDIYYAR